MSIKLFTQSTLLDACLVRQSKWVFSPAFLHLSSFKWSDPIVPSGLAQFYSNANPRKIQVVSQPTQPTHLKKHLKEKEGSRHATKKSAQSKQDTINLQRPLLTDPDTVMQRILAVINIRNTLNNYIMHTHITIYNKYIFDSFSSSSLQHHPKLNYNL